MLASHIETHNLTIGRAIFFFFFYDRPRNVAREASKSKKCDNKATAMVQTSIMDTNHNTETAQRISVMHWFIKANKKG
eukprot:scaffold31836_cov29-Attheya_sp.AAC.1